MIVKDFPQPGSDGPYVYVYNHYLSGNYVRNYEVWTLGFDFKSLMQQL